MSDMIKLKLIKNSSAELQELYTFTDHHAKQFCMNIHHYNEVFAFTSAMYETDIRIDEYTFSFQIHDELYHLQGLLESDNSKSSQYAQIYIHDSEYDNEICCHRNSKLLALTVEVFINTLHQVDF